MDDDAEVVEEHAGAKAAVEATSNYYTVYDTLDEHLDVVVADPTQTKANGYAEVKNDLLDAKLLVQLRRAGMIAESYVLSEKLREGRACAWPEAIGRNAYRLQKRSLRPTRQTRDHLRLGSVRRERVRNPRRRGFLSRCCRRSAMESFLSIIGELTSQIEELEMLMTIPGVSFYSSLLIPSEIGEIDQFDEAKQVVGYAGLDPIVCESSDSRTEGTISKC